MFLLSNTILFALQYLYDIMILYVYETFEWMVHFTLLKNWFYFKNFYMYLIVDKEMCIHLG